MSTSPRQALRTWVGRVVGERPVPLGRVAHDRRVLRRSLASRPVGRVLVVGPGLAVRQAFPHAHVDVAGTGPHVAEVTICSAVDSPGSLPPARWNTVVVSETSDDLTARLAAVRPACRPGARIVVLGCTASRAADAAREAGVGRDDQVRGTRRLRAVWVTEMPS